MIESITSRLLGWTVSMVVGSERKERVLVSDVWAPPGPVVNTGERRLKMGSDYRREICLDLKIF